jgi:hypothetical protein
VNKGDDTMTLQLLYEVLPRPEKVLEAGSADRWSEIESTLGLTLPGDYKDYINVFGTGIIGDFILPLNPFSQNEYVNLMQYNGWRIDAYKKRKEKWGEEQCPYPLYPEPGGLFCWGRTENGDTLLWKTAGDADSWSVVVNEGRTTRFEEFPVSMTVFLRDIIRGSLTSQIIDPTYIKKEVLFQPWLHSMS